MSLFGEKIGVIEGESSGINSVIEKEYHRGQWSGMTAAELSVIAQELYKIGTLSSAQYIVTLEPLNKDSEISYFEMFSEKKQNIFPFLASSCSLSILDAQTDSIQAGHYQLNHITSNSTGDVTITFLETKTGDILRFAQQLKAAMFNRNGTQSTPYQYLMKLNISLFPRHTRTVQYINQPFVVALQAASVELAAQNKDPLEVPLTFIKMFPMLAK